MALLAFLTPVAAFLLPLGRFGGLVCPMSRVCRSSPGLARLACRPHRPLDPDWFRPHSDGDPVGPPGCGRDDL